MDDAEVRQRLRMLVSTGELTCDEPEQSWAGRAQGKRCAGCLEDIVPPQIEFEVELPNFRRVFLHQRCYDMWLEVCDEQTPTPTP